MADDRASHKEKDADVVVDHADTQNVKTRSIQFTLPWQRSSMIPSEELERGDTRCVSTLVTKSVLIHDDVARDAVPAVPAE